MSMDWISKIQKNKILYIRIVTKKYHIPELKGLRIPYTQNPWPGLNWAMKPLMLGAGVTSNVKFVANQRVGIDIVPDYSHLTRIYY